jgi:hypothetical protein
MGDLQVDLENRAEKRRGPHKRREYNNGDIGPAIGDPASDYLQGALSDGET